MIIRAKLQTTSEDSFDHIFCAKIKTFSGALKWGGIWKDIHVDDDSTDVELTELGKQPHPCPVRFNYPTSYSVQGHSIVLPYHETVSAPRSSYHTSSPGY